MTIPPQNTGNNLGRLEPIGELLKDVQTGNFYYMSDNGRITQFTAGDALGYSEYVAILNQSDSDAPTASVLSNTLGGTLVWSRDGAGSYLGTLSGAFSDATKVVIYGLTDYTSIISPLNPTFVAGVNDANSIYVQTATITENDTGGNLTKTGTDGYLFNVPIIIRVYE